MQSEILNTTERVHFETAYDRFIALEQSSDSNSKDFQKIVKESIQYFHQCLKYRQMDLLLSDNEHFTELQTKQLYAICLEYYLALAVTKQQFTQDGPNLDINTGLVSSATREAQLQTRVQVLRESDVFFTEFLDRCEQVGLLTPTKRREQYERLEKSNGRIVQLSRDEKIERFRLQREMENKLKCIQERKKKYLQKTVNREFQNLDQQQESSNSVIDDEEFDTEEVERELVITFIQLAVLKALDEQTSVHQERTMLEQMLTMNNRSADKDLFSDVHRPPPPVQGQGITVTRINPQFEMKRETIRSQVFQPGHRLPTMSIEEYAERELQDAKEREEREKHTPQGPRRYDQLVEDGDEDDENLVDKATVKDRSWDDWKDANPRGIGNKGGSQF